MVFKINYVFQKPKKTTHIWDFCILVPSVKTLKKTTINEETDKKKSAIYRVASKTVTHLKN